MNNRPALDEQKAAAEEVLSEAYARGEIEIAELENKLVAVQTASNPGEIDSLLGPLAVLKPALAVSSDIHIRENTTIKTIMSSNQITGTKLQTKQIFMKTILGDTKMDYSRTELPAGRYYIDAKVILGSLTIIVPANYAVTVEMESIMADIKEKDTCSASPAVPEIILRGKAIMSDVKIKNSGGFLQKIEKFIDDII